MNLVIIIIFLLWVFRIFWNIFSYANLWFVKEYRFDRMLIHLQTDQGKWILFPPFRRPPISPKSIILVLATFIAAGAFLYFNQFSILISFFIVDLLLFPFMGFVVFLLWLPTYLYHSLLISRAISKLRSHERMLCIGVTGSFGKTSTKDYLGAILSESYVVLKTVASKNSPIGIAELVLRSLSSTHNAFVVEMGAYKKGEILEMSHMVLPEIGIITAINEQHQDLFGSIESTMKAKYELVSSLVGRKIAIMNADNPYVLSMSEWAKKDGIDVWFVTTDLKKKLDSDHVFYIHHCLSGLDGIRFTLLYRKRSYEISSSVNGEFQALNIACAIAAGVAGGMKIEDAVKGCKNIRPLSKMMEKLPGINGSTFINDTFNNNPDAASAAIEYLKLGTKRKLLVFQPMIELGSFASAAHERVGKLAGEICDEIILTNSNFHGAFMQGIDSMEKKKHVYILHSQKAAQFLQTYLSQGDMVLFKGKEAQAVLTLLEGRSL